MIKNLLKSQAKNISRPKELIKVSPLSRVVTVSLEHVPRTPQSQAEPYVVYPRQPRAGIVSFPEFKERSQNT